MKCHKCGTEVCPKAHNIEAHESFGELGKRLCGSCFDAAWEESLQLRKQYQKLVKSGVHPQIADRIVQVLINKSV